MPTMIIQNLSTREYNTLFMYEACIKQDFIKNLRRLSHEKTEQIRKSNGQVCAMG